MSYPVILANPPWTFPVGSQETGRGRSAAAHYETRDADWIASLPVASVAADDAFLFLWTCHPNLPEALRVIDAWGFTYKTLAFDWIKVTRGGKPWMGKGYWTRGDSEPCLLGTRGRPPRLNEGIGEIIAAVPCKRPEKPEEQYERIESLVDGPYLELFHRPRNGLLLPRPGWTFIGDAVTGRDIREDLARLHSEAKC